MHSLAEDYDVCMYLLCVTNRSAARCAIKSWSEVKCMMYDSSWFQSLSKVSFNQAELKIIFSNPLLELIKNISWLFQVALSLIHRHPLIPMFIFRLRLIYALVHVNPSLWEARPKVKMSHALERGKLLLSVEKWVGEGASEAVGLFHHLLINNYLLRKKQASSFMARHNLKCEVGPLC